MYGGRPRRPNTKLHFCLFGNFKGFVYFDAFLLSQIIRRIDCIVSDLWLETRILLGS